MLDVYGFVDGTDTPSPAAVGVASQSPSSNRPNNFTKKAKDGKTKATSPPKEEKTKAKATLPPLKSSPKRSVLFFSKIKHLKKSMNS
jgi:hypothetical protein